MAWAGISSNSRTAIVVVPGKLTSRRYIDKILRPHVVPYLRQMGQSAIFQDDNARPHRARIVDDFLRQIVLNDLSGRQCLRTYPALSTCAIFLAGP